MSNSKNLFLKQIEKYLSFLNNLSAEEIANLENGEATVRFEIINVYKKYTPKGNSIKLFNENNFVPEEIISYMLKLESREIGEIYLSSKCSSKADFIILAKKLDLPFEKKDSIEKIKNKIIEATIGFRLRSQAIQG